jgi:hypothetical protein
MNTPSADDERFARLCRCGALERIQIHAGHRRALAPLTVSAHVLDADAGDLALRLRYGSKTNNLWKRAARRTGKPERGSGSASMARKRHYWLTMLLPFWGIRSFLNSRVRRPGKLVNEALQAPEE